MMRKLHMRRLNDERNTLLDDDMIRKLHDERLHMRRLMMRGRHDRRTV